MGKQMKVESIIDRKFSDLVGNEQKLMSCSGAKFFSKCGKDSCFYTKVGDHCGEYFWRCWNRKRREGIF